MNGTQSEQAEIFVKDGEQITGITPEAAEKLKEAGFDEKAIEKMAYEDVEKNLTAKPEEYEITETQAKELESLGYSQEDISAMTESDVKEALEGEPGPILITEDMTERFPFAKSLVGKPITELLDVLQNQQVRIGQLERSKTQPEKKTETKQEDYEYPDPLDDPKGYAEAISQKILSSITPLLQQPKQQASQEDFYRELKKHLPEDVNPEEAMNSWRTKEGAYLPEEMIDVYTHNPELLMKHVATYARLNAPKKQPKKRKDFAQVKQAITKSGGEDNKYNAVPRPNSLKDDATTAMVKKILARNS